MKSSFELFNPYRIRKNKTCNSVNSSTLLRFPLMYTNINIFCIMMSSLWSENFKDVIRANSLIILSAISYFWITGMNWKLYVEMYESFSEVLPKLDRLTIIYLSTLIDIPFHLLPVIIIGLPRNNPLLYVIIASICVLTWYFAVRRNK
jgi:hypothetical protein